MRITAVREGSLNYDVGQAPILLARRINLCVLAPAAYYEPYSLAWLEQLINGGLHRIVDVTSKAGLSVMRFQFQQFPLHFQWTANTPVEELPKRWDGNRVPAERPDFTSPQLT